ncbi:hypothetical protein ASZ90_002738 [hydrocarbon metagenome]|uniref:Heme exporter protein B n=1 Tax=hydrocarbon metagenome TaxID=938273 RepID=A0A0W8G2N1_9ZZZZ
MLSRAAAVAAKDVRLSLAGAQGPAQTVLLGLILIFIFSLSRDPGELFPPLSAAAVFWLATAFGQVLVFNTLYSLEEGGCRDGLLLSPAPVQAVWLGKAAAGMALLLACQAVFAPAVVAFLGQRPAGSLLSGLFFLLVADWGIVALGSLLGAISAGRGARESLLTVVLFPLLTPLLLAAIRLTEGVLSGEPADVSLWLGMALAFDAVFTAAALALFPSLYSGED